LERPFERAGGATGTDWRKSFDLQDGNLPWTHTEQTALEPLNEAIIMESTSKPLLKNPPAFAGIINAAVLQGRGAFLSGSPDVFPVAAIEGPSALHCINNSPTKKGNAPQAESARRL
jgi:hypothetical protein